MNLRRWVLLVAALGLATIAVEAGVVYRLRTVGRADVQVMTERIAVRVAAGDREALAAEPVFAGRLDSVDWLLARRHALAAGYEVSAERNGENGRQLLSPESVSHLGVVKTATGALVLGYWFEPSTKKLTFVSASSTAIAPAAPP